MSLKRFFAKMYEAALIKLPDWWWERWGNPLRGKYLRGELPAIHTKMVSAAAAERMPVPQEPSEVETERRW